MATRAPHARRPAERLTTRGRLRRPHPARPRLPRRVEGLLPAARHHDLPRRLRARHGALVVVGRVAPRGRRLLRAGHRQGLYALFGVPLMLIASRMPDRFWKRCALAAAHRRVRAPAARRATPLGSRWAATELARDRRVAVPAVGVRSSSRSCIWLGLIVTKKQTLLGDWRTWHPADPPVGGGAIGLVLLGDDLGTAMIMVRDRAGRAVLRRGAAAAAAAARARSARRSS